MMRKKLALKNTTLLAAALLLLAFSPKVYASSANLSPKQEKEWNIFIESQISDEDRAILDELALRITNILDTNYSLDRLFTATVIQQPQVKYLYSTVKRYGTDQLKQLRKKQLPLLAVEKISHSLPQADELLAVISDIGLFYKRCADLGTRPQNEPLLLPSTTGAYHYLSMRLKSFEEAIGLTLGQLFEYSDNAYKTLAAYAGIHDMQSTAVQAQALSEDFKQAQSAIIAQLIHPLEVSNKSFVNDALVIILGLTERHLALNYLLCAKVAERTSQIPMPQAPRLPDLSVLNLELGLPKNIAVKKTVQVFAEFKNQGELSVPPSKALLTMPDGSERKISLPELKPGQTYVARKPYRIKFGGENIFSAAVNIDRNVFETDYTNNSIRRSLILPRSSK